MMLFCNVVGMLHCIVVILCCGNIAGTSFSQRCENNLLTMLYNIVFTLRVCWVYPSGDEISSFRTVFFPAFLRSVYFYEGTGV